MAKIIRYDGVVEDVSPACGDKFNYEQLEIITGGYFDIKRSMLENDDRVIVVDSDANEKGKYYNHRATMLLIRMGYHDDFLSGNVIVCHDYEIASDLM